MVLKYTVSLSDKDRLHRKYEKDRGKIISFVIQLSSKTPTSWKVVVRYDTCHGVAHKDVFAYSKKRKIRRVILGGPSNYNDIFTEVDKYIMNNLEVIKERFMFQ